MLLDRPPPGDWVFVRPTPTPASRRQASRPTKRSAARIVLSLTVLLSTLFALKYERSALTAETILQRRRLANSQRSIAAGEGGGNGRKVFIPPSMDGETRRRLSLNLGLGNCQWEAPEYEVPGTINFYKTLIAGFPGCEKRMTFIQMEALTGWPARDEWEFVFYGAANHPFIKSNYPHHEGFWSWGNRADQVVLVVQNIRRTMVEYHNILWDIAVGKASGYGSYDWGSDVVVYKNRPGLNSFLQWRDLRVMDEIHWYGWYIDYWMEGGLRRDIFTNKLTTEEAWPYLPPDPEPYPCATDPWHLHINEPNTCSNDENYSTPPPSPSPSQEPTVSPTVKPPYVLNGAGFCDDSMTLYNIVTFDLVADSSQCATVCTSSADSQVRFAGYTYSSSSSDQFCDCFFVGGLPTIASFTECTGLPGCYTNATTTGSATDQSGDECYKSSLFPWDVQFESIGLGTCLSQNSNGVGLGATDLIEHQYLSSTSGDCELACKFISVEASDNLVAFSFGVDLESGLNSCKCHFEKGFLTSAIPGGGNCPDDLLSCKINGNGAGPITGTDNDANFECFRNYNFGVAPTGNPTSPPTAPPTYKLLFDTVEDCCLHNFGQGECLVVDVCPTPAPTPAVVASYDPNCELGKITNGCEPIEVISTDKLRDFSEGPAETERIANTLAGTAKAGISQFMIDQEAWECIWDEIIVSRQGGIVANDRPNWLLQDYNFSSEMLEAMLTELNRLIAKYETPDWTSKATAVRLVELLKEQRVDVQSELNEVLSGARALTELDFLGPAEREHRSKIKAERGGTGLAEVTPQEKVKDFQFFNDLEVKAKSWMRKAFASERQKEWKAAQQQEKQRRANRESYFRSVK